MERVADCIIRKINEFGAKHIFLITGRGILYLTDAVARNEKIRGISTYHEQGASYSAMAYASCVNGIAACLVSTGCAATNAVTACLCAYQDNLPVVFISGNNMLSENTRYTGAAIRTYGSQETDIIRIVESVTKYAVMLTDPGRVVYEVEKALHIATEGRKGPVWIDVPLDVQNMRIEERELEHYGETWSLPALMDEDIHYVRDSLNKAERPVLLIGGGVRSACAGTEIKALVEEYHMPLVFSPTAADVYGTSKDLSIGAVGSLGGSRAGNFTVQNSDFVLAIGTKLCSQETGVSKNFVRDGKIVVVDIDKSEHSKNGVDIERTIYADAKEFLDGLLESNIHRVSDRWTEKCQHWKEIFAVKNETFIKELQAGDEIDLYLLGEYLSVFLPENATIITDAGFEELIIPSSIKYREGQRCLFPASQGAMGYAIPAIIGAHYAGRKNIICIVGDGSIMMNIQELGIIAANHIPAIIFVINNNMYSVIRKRQTDLFRRRTIGNDPSDGVPAPDFQLIANSYGFSYDKIQSLSELPEKMKKIFSSEDGCYLYEIMSSPDQKYLHESYALNEKRRLVHRPIEDLSPFLDRDIIKEEMIIEMME